MPTPEELARASELWGELADTLAAWVADQRAFDAKQNAGRSVITGYDALGNWHTVTPAQASTAGLTISRSLG